MKYIEGYDVTIENVSSEYDQLAIQGPNARALVQKFTETDLSDLKMFNFVTGAQVDGKDVIISQSGYTGEDGFELYTKPEDTLALWKLFVDNGAVECGLRSEEHTSELQSRFDLVCRLLLAK